MSEKSKGGYCPNESAELWDWPLGWTGGHNQEHRFNIIETWMLCAVCLQKWEALAQVAWYCMGSLFTAPLDYTSIKGDRAGHLPQIWQSRVPK
eukprot:6206689-Amphidinium_carterae.1